MLFCSPAPVYRWVKIDDEKGEQTITKETNHVEFGPFNHSLILHNVTGSHNGTYRCMISRNSTQVNDTARIIVRGKNFILQFYCEIVLACELSIPVKFRVGESGCITFFRFSSSFLLISWGKKTKTWCYQLFYDVNYKIHQHLWLAYPLKATK